MNLQHNRMFDDGYVPLDVSIVMPCLNEIQSLQHCVANARDALNQIERKYGLAGEIVIADNGSTDGSQALATSLGARVVSVSRKGYGAALIGGFDQAYGRFLIMGDCDGSYDFTDGVAMIGRLLDGADLCMGSRFKGGIAPGAMPWKNRYIGNPVLTGILNLFFRTGIEDAHCGLRAIRREAYEALGLDSTGMEFASEMVIKASLKHLRTDQVAATLSPDLRDRAPHLRPWRDGWRHLRYLFMLSPTWTFGVPAFALMGAGSVILIVAALYALGFLPGEPRFGTSWSIAATFMLTTGHFAAIMALATHLYGVRQGYRPLRAVFYRIGPVFTLENFLITGTAMIAVSVTALLAIFFWWGALGFTALPTILPFLVTIVVGIIGIQTTLSGILLAIINGHDVNFCPGLDERNIIRPGKFNHVNQHAHPAKIRKLQIGNYTIVSAVCVIIQNVVLLSSDLMGLHYATAVLISTSILIPVGFILQSNLTFENEKTWNAFMRYAGAMASNLPLSIALAWGICGVLQAPMLLASPAISACLFFWNYFTSKWALTRITIPKAKLSQR